MRSFQGERVLERNVFLRRRLSLRDRSTLRRGQLRLRRNVVPERVLPGSGVPAAIARGLRNGGRDVHRLRSDDGRLLFGRGVLLVRGILELSARYRRRTRRRAD